MIPTSSRSNLVGRFPKLAPRFSILSLFVEKVLSSNTKVMSKSKTDFFFFREKNRKP